MSLAPIADILAPIGLFLIASGFITFLARTTIRQYFNQQLEKYKHDLSLEKIKFSKLHELRGQVIVELYAKLVDFERKMATFTSPLQLIGDPTQEDKQKEAAKAGNDFDDFSRKNQIFFNQEFCDMLDNIRLTFRRSWTDYVLLGGGNTGEPKFEKWQEAWEIISKKIPKLRGELEKELREILGVT